MPLKRGWQLINAKERARVYPLVYDPTPDKLERIIGTGCRLKIGVETEPEARQQVGSERFWCRVFSVTTRHHFLVVIPDGLTMHHGLEPGEHLKVGFEHVMGIEDSSRFQRWPPPWDTYRAAPRGRPRGRRGRKSRAAVPQG